MKRLILSLMFAWTIAQFTGRGRMLDFLNSLPPEIAATAKVTAGLGNQWFVVYQS